MVRLFRYLTTVAATGLLGAVLLGYGGAVFFPLDLLAHFRLHLLLLIPLILIPAILLGNFTAVMRLTTAALFATAGLAPLWQPVVTTTEGYPLTVLNANLSTRNDQADLARAALVSADADILVTHETTKTMLTGVTSLARHYDYRLSLSTSGQQLRTVIWSKYPMSAGRLLLEDLVEPTGAMATIDLGEGREVLVAGLHLAHSAIGNQEVQIDALGGLLADKSHPRILLGDFNATPWSWAMQRVSEISGTRLMPGYRITWAGSYPSLVGDIPALIGQPIDHILASPQVGLGAIETFDIPGSDHRAVKATLLLP